MKINVWWGFALLILLLIVLFFIQFRQKQYQEHFVTPTSANIQYYVIHDPSNQERNENIQRQETKLGKPIHRFNAVMGNTVNLQDLSVFDPKLQNNYNNRNKNEYGCYLSHFMLIKSLSEQHSSLDHGYTVIFEDDFQIMTDNLESKIQHAWNIIENEQQVDMLFLGHLDTYIGPLYKENLFEVDFQNTQDFSGTHGYVLRNQSIPRILESLYVIDNPIDYKFGKLFHDGQLRALLMNPTVVDQTNDIISSIGLNR
jgi:GR25 family glycosyltransferase involved in LPS biosynthesis